MVVPTSSTLIKARATTYDLRMSQPPHPCESSPAGKSPMSRLRRCLQPAGPDPSGHRRIARKTNAIGRLRPAPTYRCVCTSDSSTCLWRAARDASTTDSPGFHGLEIVLLGTPGPRGEAGLYILWSVALAGAADLDFPYDLGRAVF